MTQGLSEKLVPNPGKKLDVVLDGKRYSRLPVKTHVIAKGDDIPDVVAKYAGAHLKPADIVFVSEKIVAIAQGRAYPITEIKPGRLAMFLVKFVHKSPYGIGLGSPWTMELAIREAGAFRIILGALASAITKPFGIKGVFYKVVGNNINAIDGPCDYTLPPYDKYAKLGPSNPDGAARDIKNKIGMEAVIIDANDLSVETLGRSDKNISEKLIRSIFKDNPLGQSSEQTPICIVRENK